MRIRPAADSAQSSIDFIFGISIFIISIFFLYNVLNTIFIPFQLTSDETKAMVDRVGAELVENPGTTGGLAISTSYPNILDKTSIVQLNNDLNDSVTYDNKIEHLGLVTGTVKYKLNVSLRYFNYSLYPDASNPILSAGETPDEYTSTSQVMRVVYIPDESRTLMLLVKVWL